MKTKVSSGIDKILFFLFFIVYTMIIVVTSAVLTGCTSDEIVEGPTLENAQGVNGKQQDAKIGNDDSSSFSDANSANSARDVVKTRDVNVASDANSANSARDVVKTRDVNVASDTNMTSDANATDDMVKVNIGEDGQVSEVNDASSADNSTENDSSNDAADEDSEDDSDSSDVSDVVDATNIATIQDVNSVPVQDTNSATIQDTNSGSIQDVNITQQPDVITVTSDVVAAIKDVVTDIFMDTSTGYILDIIAEIASQKPDISQVPDIQSIPDIQEAKDMQDTQDIQQIQAPDITQVNDGTTCYKSSEYGYKVQFPSWVAASQLKTSDILLSGNALNKNDLTNQQLNEVAHFTLRTEFEYYPEYMTYDGWWKNLYGKPDEVVMYKGQTLMFHSVDSDGGFSRYTYAKIGASGAVRIEMHFSMPEHLYTEGFEEKALEVLNMVTNSAQAAN